MTNDVPFTQWAGIHQTDKFICIEPLSGYLRFLREDEGYRIYLEPVTTVEALGKTLLDALNRSRFIHPHKDRAFFEAAGITRSYQAWEQDFMTRYGYKTKREAYQNMRYCFATRREGKISITPHRREAKPGYIADLPAEKTVVIPATRDHGIVGAAAQLALSNCE